MSALKKNHLLNIFLGVIILLSIGIPGFSLTCQNGAGGGTGGGDKAAEVNPVENLVIQGAIYYLQSCSDVQAILKRVEQSAFKPVDYAEMQQVVNEALDQIKAARVTYEALLKTAAETPPNPAFILGLQNFDYQAFMTENGLIEPVFKKVEEYLSRGDVPGLLASVYVELKSIESQLQYIRKYVSIYRLPALSVFWKLNETCAAASLLGSYSTRVFYAVNR